MFNANELICWFAGLFEGEGSFIFHKGKAKRMVISSVDKDVIQRVQEEFGGKIYTSDRSSKHPTWKLAYIWVAYGEKAYDICTLIRPYLLSRRGIRCDEFLTSYISIKQNIENRTKSIKENRNKILEYRVLGYTHSKIATLTGYERSSISKILNGS